MIEPIRIDENAVYDDGVLVMKLGLTSTSIIKARREGRLRYHRIGNRVIMRGAWINDWLFGEPQIKTEDV